MKPICDNRRHLVCLPYSIKNLHRMAAQLNLKRHWFHRDHYDIPVGRRSQIEHAALQVNTKTIVRLIHAYNNLRSSMTIETMEQGMDTEARLLQSFKEQGKKKAHFCPNWHYMAIHENSVEFEGCQCSEDHLQ